MIFPLLLIACAIIVTVATDAPLAPGLAQSQWPIAHASTWNSDYTANRGPRTKASTVQLFVNGDNFSDILDILKTADPITLVQSNVTGITWGSSISGIFQTKTDPVEGLQVINTFFRDYNFEYHGAYCLLAHDGTYYAATRDAIVAYNNEVPFDFTTPIVKTKEYAIQGLSDDEHIVGLTLTHDPAESAFLIFATSNGHIGGVSLDFTTATNLVEIPGRDTVALPSHFVSNSIAMDGVEGGIYACTSYSMSRIQWNPQTQSLSLAWNTPYGTGADDWYWGRLGPGCGTSPTILGPHNQKPEFVVINDGENPMNVRFYDVHSGEEVGRHVVTFGQSLPCNSTTDQSIVVKGYDVVLVNNWVADSVTSFCADIFWNLPGVTDALRHECPFIFGAFVNGIEQFHLDPTTHVVTSNWANSEVSCTSSIPVVSEEGVLYCLGKRVQTEDSHRPRPYYTIEAVSWKTGESLFYVPLGSTLLYNSLYAATEISTAQDIVMGTLSGLVRVAPKLSTQEYPRCKLQALDESVCVYEALRLQDGKQLSEKTREFWNKIDAIADEIFLETYKKQQKKN